MKRNKRFLLSILLGAILGLVWNIPVFLPIIFVLFAGVLRLIDSEYKLSRQYFLIILPFIISWHLSVLWWVWNASIGGFVFMTIFGTVIISMAYLVYAIARKINLPMVLRYILWITTALSLEYFHYNWEGNFPWLNLGNSFSVMTPAIQWICYTGVAGVSLWILLTNALVHHTLAKNQWGKKRLLLILGCIVVPMLVSWLWLQIDTTYRVSPSAQTTQKLQIVIIQPNIDTYSGKFVLSPEAQISKFLEMSIQAQEKLDTTKTILWLWPETCLPDAMPFRRVSSDERDLFIPYHEQLIPIQQYLLQHPHIYLIVGGVLYGYSPSFGQTVAYNEALGFNQTEVLYSHTKSRLVPGAEAMPYQKYLKFLEQFMIDLGGSTFPLERSTKPLLPFHIQKENPSVQLGTIICYESIFGEYVSQYVQNGTELLCVITNDDWWGNTPGHKQHFNYGKMRAIENRKYLARSANTGISAIINPYGEVVSEMLHYKQEGTIVGYVYPNRTQTVYASYGDYLYVGGMYVWLMSVLIAIFYKKKGK